MRSLTLIAALWAPAVLAECPVAADLDTGIRMRTADGAYEELKTFTPGTVTSHYYENGTLDSRVLLARGLYMVEFIQARDGALDTTARDTYSYGHSPQDIPLPEVGKSLQMPVVINEGGEISQGLDVFEADPETTMTFGDCTYTVLPVRMYFDPADRETYDILHYLPDLGASYLARSFYPGADDVYDYVAIEKME
ncbi:hypothetical protein [Tropicibacter sp. S64]|uniref:hypothetical protein n=1 Tax=Tropicibacter sp. S64 TaxID=3415122 RepID=UPI003C7E224E